MQAILRYWQKTENKFVEMKEFNWHPMDKKEFYGCFCEILDVSISGISWISKWKHVH